ncbi:maleylpyruvate isomerase family mycothiol-dependent enzyme [Allokutzneria sp. A3M-2-11 16]|uniref:maleylpyruvate isomerase family mycothiol-dependent enzyme n=1 Tax=Allokutzneria sp. A3M-2-11 16 TaxID=2962043 RepID=UPI0020B8BE5B|nr:maleylpyruvate isomerase family mycothiol-dependent enzyme [Allokutzneria sp. A3M-2-11 16]MCP3805110.1 maleylpyruvate isomerase family mycothiol-dependent enzyme [Allokutzneria sp. A3M-2-11 16]
MSSTMTLAVRERADFADFLDKLAPEQWDLPTLCAGWTVREVVAHVISYDVIGWRGAFGRLARGRFSLHRANAIGVAEYADTDLVALFRTYARPRGLTTAFGGRIALVDGMIHQQDIRRPLGLPREIPHDRLLVALRFALFAPPLGAGKQVRGLTLTATDVEWSHGSGPEVRGPGEALLMAIAGRCAALPELTGPGVPLLTSRLT